MDTSPTLAVLLPRLRDRRRLSQSRLAERAGFDHSYISRIECGNRTPTRNGTLAIAAALELDEAETDILLMSAGYAPDDYRSPFLHVPELARLIDLIVYASMPPERRKNLIATVGGIAAAYESTAA